MLVLVSDVAMTHRQLDAVAWEVVGKQRVAKVWPRVVEVKLLLSRFHARCSTWYMHPNEALTSVYMHAPPLQEPEDGGGHRDDEHRGRYRQHDLQRLGPRLGDRA